MHRHAVSMEPTHRDCDECTMTKQVYVLDGPYEDGGVAASARGSTEVAGLMRTNNRSHTLLEVCKNAISAVCTNTKTKRWDECKRMTNMYELVHTGSASYPGVATHEWGMPTSRSFYKLWEILYDYRAELGVDRDTSMRAAFLAEGPGGFIEAFARYRDGRHVDSLYGMTLVLPRNRNVPSWKVTLPSVEAHLHAGDLYVLSDIDAFVAAAGGEGSCDLVTADGGFDFSHDFNAQERTSTRLIVSEIYTALLLQREGGHFILKIYDVRTPTTMRLLYLLRRCYQTVRLIKPLTSRPANSEKYVLCTCFRRRERERLLFGPIDYDSMCEYVGQTSARSKMSEQLSGAMGVLRSAVDSTYFPLAGAARVAYSLPAPPPLFVMDIVQFNMHFVSRQAACIQHTLALAAGASHTPDMALKRRQLDCALQWCRKYGISCSSTTSAVEELPVHNHHAGRRPEAAQ